MAFYVYRALDEYGDVLTGEVEAPNVRNAVGIVRNRGLKLIKIEAKSGEEKSPSNLLSLDVQDFLPITLADRVLFFQQMALMTRAGISVLQALEIAAELSLSVRLSKAINACAADIRAGSSLSDAMNNRRKVFPQLSIHLIRSAEASGELDTVLERLADHLEQQAETRRNLLTSLVYPVVVIIVAVGVAIFLLAAVVPKFARFFQQGNKVLPPITQALVDVSAAVTTYWLLIVLMSGILAALTAYAYSKPSGRLMIDRGLLKTPFVGAVLLRASLAQVTWSLALLLRSGITVLEAIQVSRVLVSNRAIDVALEHATDSLLAGRDFSSSINRQPIPELIARLAAVGEKAGSLEHVMQELGDHYDNELQASIKRMSNLVEPILMLIVGGMVGFVYYAFFQAIFSVV